MQATAPDLDSFKLDAYGHLSYTVGWSDEDQPEDAPDRGDWLACVDFDRQGDFVGFHVVVNSDSGGFIDTLESGVLTLEEARDKLPCLLEYWDDIGSEHLSGDGHWYTDEERAECLKAIQRWKEALKEGLA